jgi:hypothetical protein
MLHKKFNVKNNFHDLQRIVLLSIMIRPKVFEHKFFDQKFFDQKFFDQKFSNTNVQIRLSTEQAKFMI